MKSDPRIPTPLPGGHQSVSFTGTSAASAAMGDQTRKAVLYATEDCHINLEAAATTADFFVPASVVILLAVTPGQPVNVIQSGVGGSLHISECA